MQFQVFLKTLKSRRNNSQNLNYFAIILEFPNFNAIFGPYGEEESQRERALLQIATQSMYSPGHLYMRALALEQGSRYQVPNHRQVGRQVGRWLLVAAPPQASQSIFPVAFSRLLNIYQSHVGVGTYYPLGWLARVQVTSVRPHLEFQVLKFRDIHYYFSLTPLPLPLPLPMPPEKKK